MTATHDTIMKADRRGGRVFLRNNDSLSLSQARLAMVRCLTLPFSRKDSRSRTRV